MLEKIYQKRKLVLVIKFLQNSNIPSYNIFDSVIYNFLEDLVSLCKNESNIP
jgi:hypothetical protein